MPQIAGEDLPDFERYLATKGIILRKKVMPTRNLKLTQSEFNKLKVLKIMRKIGASRTFDPIIISKDGYVLDGSHRYLAVHNSRADATMPTLKASVNIRELLDAARSYPKVTFRTYSDNKAS
jgi:ParB-like chromosome segregation protein Spo0J